MAQDRNSKAKAGIALSLGAAVSAIAVAIGTRKAHAAPETETPGGVVKLDDDTLTLLAAIGDAINRMMGSISDIITAIRNIRIAGGGGGGTPVPNCDSVNFFAVVINTTNVGQQLPDFGVPDGFELQLKASSLNAATVWLGNTRAGSIDRNTSWPLLQNEAHGQFIKNANALWVSGTAGDIIYGSCERRRNGGG